MITVLENLNNALNQVVDVPVTERGGETYIYSSVNVRSYTIGAKYSYTFVFQGIKGRYGTFQIDGTDKNEVPIEYTGDVQELKVTATRLNGNSNGFYFAKRGPHNFELGESVKLISAHVTEGDVPSDIYTPYHGRMTPEQIAMLPPYGEYKEIKSF